MIDELVKVANSMRDANIVPIDWHPKLKTLPKVSKKSPCIRVWLTDDGHIKDVELLSEEQAGQLRKYEPNNGEALPGFNVRPLYRIVKSDDEIKKAGRGREGEGLKADWVREFLSRDFEDQAKDDFWDKTRDTLAQCFGKVNDELKEICGEQLTDGETLLRFFNSIRQIDVSQFQKEYFNAVRHKVETGEIPSSLLYYFTTESKKRKEDEDSRTPVQKFSVFLDIKDYAGYPVAHTETISRLNTLLMGDGNERDASGEDVIESDAYGLAAYQKEEKFPGVALPFLGGVILRSQAKTIPAQKRYHQCESDTFPVGAKIRRRTKAALEWIADRARDGETYGVAGDQELLFAYPKVLPKSKIPFAKMLGAQPDANLQKERFEKLAKSVIEQLKGSGQSAADAELEIFSLRKMNKAQTKVTYYRNATVALIEAASLSWHKGCQNIPLLDVWDWSEEKNEKTGKSYPILIEPVTVFPVKLHRFLNAVWKRDGTRADAGKTKVSIFRPTDGLRLLLENPCDALATHMMKRFMQQAQGYFLTLCRSVGRHEIVKQLPDKVYYPGILGLLLFKLGKRKEAYMNESAVQLGRCLRVADELHRLYCEVVRKKELPSELCGSSLLVGMMESPGMTLSQLAMRSAPYLKWARGGGDKGEKGGLVWYWLRQWEEIANPLLEKGWPKRLTPDERAQVFLGYLSSFPKKENSGGSETMDESEEGGSK